MAGLRRVPVIVILLLSLVVAVHAQDETPPAPPVDALIIPTQEIAPPAADPTEAPVILPTVEVVPPTEIPTEAPVIVTQEAAPVETEATGIATEETLATEAPVVPTEEIVETELPAATIEPVSIPESS